MNKLYVLFDKYRRYYRQFRVLTIRDAKKKADYFRKKKIFYHVGKNVYYYPNILPAEPFLVCLHDNIIIAAGTRLITHSVENIIFNNEDSNLDKKKFACKYGKIEIHDNVYIGANAIIKFGVTIGKNCVIAAGAVVTKDVPEGSVVAGIPAKVIGSYEDLKKRRLEYSQEFINMKGPKTVENMIKIKPVHFDIDRVEYKGK